MVYRRWRWLAASCYGFVLLGVSIPIHTVKEKDLAPDDALFINALFITAGISLIIFRKPLARASVEQRNRFYGTRFGERSVKFYEYSAILLGLCFVVFSVVDLLGVIGR